ACLEPSTKPNVGALDNTPPSVCSTKPPINDAGVSTLAASDAIEVAFSEPMDIYSLRPGIAVTKDKDELALELLTPLPTPRSFSIGDGCDGGVPWVVSVTPVDPFQPNVIYRL